MFKFEIINQPKFKIKKTILKNILREINKIIDKKQKGTLNIIFVSSKEIKKLNKNYRNINKPTDVLSFGYFTDFSKLKSFEIAGEIVFCEEKISYQGLKYGLGEEKEFYKLFIHSVLHILGFDHELENDYKIMQNFENIIWTKIFEKNT